MIVSRWLKINAVLVFTKYWYSTFWKIHPTTFMVRTLHQAESLIIQLLLRRFKKENVEQRNGKKVSHTVYNLFLIVRQILVPFACLCHKVKQVYFTNFGLVSKTLKFYIHKVLFLYLKVYLKPYFILKNIIILKLYF